ncbi:MAG: DUF4358 domain-containing protein [Clostridiales bacterium]|nr:DUF4358 domain-containing protein [Clostridiales bacterium]
MKKTACLLLAAMFLFLFFGCGKGGADSADATASDAPLTARDIADRIFAGVKFDDTLTAAPESSAMSVYRLTGYTGDCAYFVSTMATPEEIAVFKTDENHDVAKLKDAAQNRIELQIDNYSSYAPKEVPKLENAVIYTGEDVVVVCVSADNKTADSLIKGLF